MTSSVDQLLIDDLPIGELRGYELRDDDRCLTLDHGIQHACDSSHSLHLVCLDRTMRVAGERTFLAAKHCPDYLGRSSLE